MFTAFRSLLVGRRNAAKFINERIGDVPVTRLKELKLKML